MSKFEDAFSEPMHFSDGSYVISGKITIEEAAEEFSHYIGEEVAIEFIRPDRVRYGFAPEWVEDIDAGEACWYTGATGKGSQPVWVYN